MAQSDGFLNSWRGFRHSIDEFNGLAIEFGYSPNKDGLTFTAELKTQSMRNRQRDELIPTQLQEGIEVFVNGQRVDFNRTTEEGPSVSKYLATPMIKTSSEITVEFKFFGHSIGKYKINKNNEPPVEQLQEQKLISRFDLRMFSNPKQNLQEAKNYIEEWKKYPRFINRNGKAGEYFIDLHTHLAGAISTRALLQIAREFELPYPADLLDQLGIRYKAHRVFEENGKKYLDYYAWQHPELIAKFNIDPVETIAFEEMSEMYKLRDPFVKNPKIFKRILEEIAKDYNRMGVRYAELSFYTIVRPEFYEMANQYLPELEKLYGVKINFLVGLWRHSSQQANRDAIRETKQAMEKCPYVVGVDFMGHESNPTLDFKEALVELSRLKSDHPDMALRVHAGENPNHQDNIVDAIKYGATRIGHGIYGVTEEVIRLAKEKGVIIEFNFNSNLALQNVDGPQKLAETAKKYLDAGVKVTLGTDGHGLYMTTPSSEIATARAVGFSQQDFFKIWNNNYSYEQKMKLWQQKRQHLQKVNLVEPSLIRTTVKSCEALFAH